LSGEFIKNLLVESSPEKIVVSSGELKIEIENYFHGEINYLKMEMKKYLLDTFGYNDYANRKQLEKIILLPEKEECVNLFSHLIHSQNKWLARLTNNLEEKNMKWFDAPFALEELESQWTKSLTAWLNFIGEKTDEQLFSEVQYTGLDGNKFEAKLQDIALQLNYHSIHHRAQMQSIIRRQGLTPDFLDYIGTVYKKIS
jgi:uncharacterized damage-inducible protein DinB